MSLLLDALKKAADDKKKKSDDAVVDLASSKVSSVKVDNSADASLDLELHDPDGHGVLSPSQNEDPQLDDSALYDDSEPEIDTSSVDTAESFTDTEDNLLSDVASDSVDDNEQTNVKLSSDEQIMLSSASDNKAADNNEPDIKQYDINDTIDDATTEQEDTIPPTTDTDEITLKPIKLSNSHSASNDNNTINNERALSALINKSNSHSKLAKRRQAINVGILTTLIFIGSGLYFYIQKQTATQDIYIPSTNLPVVNRDKTHRQTPSQAEKKEIEAVQKIIVTAAADKPITPMPSVNKTASIKPAKKQQAISIVRTKKSDPIHGLLNAAYTEFNQANYQKSEELYNKVIQREPKNRDALLGLSAIAIKQQRYEFARQKYQFLLRLNPRDSIATAGISSIKRMSDTQLNESQLKFMLKQQPDAAHLYFALGNLYSAQYKWPEAQSAYFSAWSAENKNADYAYNLAVSLDHLDKKNQALDFYQLSLKLMNHSDSHLSASNFSAQKTQQRIQMLQEHIQ